MTHRNDSKTMYGKVILNGDEAVDLGRTSMIELIQRANAVVKSRIDLNVESANIHMAETKEQLAKMMKGGVQAKYAHEGLNPDSPLYGFDESVIKNMQVIDDDDPSPFEGVSMSRLMEANSSPEFEAYRTLACSPEKRVGIEMGVIEALREAWHEAYPDVAKHIPPWKE